MVRAWAGQDPERKRGRRDIERELRESEARYHALIESALDGVITIDHENRIVEFNPAAEAIFGWRREQVIGRDLGETLIPLPLRTAHRHGLDRHLYSAQAPRLNVRLELGALRSDGTEVPIEITVTRMVGEPPRFTAQVRDLTQQRSAQQALQESERRLASLLANLPGMAYRCRNEPDWPIEFASGGALPLTGYAPEDFVSGAVHYERLIHPDDREQVWQGVQRAVAGRRPYQLNYRITACDGSLKWVWEQGAAVLDPAGNVLALEGFVTDITERRQAQDEITRLNAELEERVRRRTEQLQAANRELEAFAYSLAHDIRSPLTSIDGFSLVLAEYESQLDDRARHYLDRIRRGVQQMSELTDALLALADLSRVDLRDEPVDLANAARIALAQLNEREPGRTWTAEIPPRLWARGDSRLLSQVMANLVGNAWKFSAHKPRTVVRVGSRPGPDGQTVYFVADEGAGFDMAHASRLFGAFQRLHTASEFEGTGIGLALVQKVVVRHGGRIWADARPGEGATFYFTLGTA